MRLPNPDVEIEVMLPVPEPTRCRDALAPAEAGSAELGVCQQPANML